MVGPVMQSDSDEELRKQKKKEKRERKRLEKERLAAEAPQQQQPRAQPVPTVVAVEEEAVESDEARRQRKAEKKERKRKRREEEAAEAQLSAQSDSTSPATKSAKLNATSAPSSSSAASSSSTAALSAEEAEAYRTKHRIQINTADSHIHPITSFAAAGFLPSLLAATASFTSPSPIQAQCWPVLMQARDCIAIAETGSGKTLGFLLPSLHHILTHRSSSSSASPASARRLPASPSMLIMSPTRELALQTKAVCDEATKQLDSIRCACIYGGVDKWQQKKELEAGVSVIVATPGRLLGLIEEGWIALSSVRQLVLDEADRMLDMGFEPDIRAIMKHIESDGATNGNAAAAGRGRNGRQTLMFSATWPASVQKLAHEFITDAVHINIGDVELKANHRVKQIIEVLQTDHDKQRRLLSLLQQLHSSQSPLAVKGRPPRILLFVLYKKEVDSMDRTVQRAGYKCVAISGDKGQQQRESALQSFRTGSINIMIATDVVGRGLDIDDIDCVINFTFPLTVEDYVHRIGRTGRGGKSGTSYTFFTRNEKHLSGELINVLREAGEEVPSELLAFGTGVKRKEHGFFGNFFKKVDGDGQEMKKAVKVRFDD